VFYQFATGVELFSLSHSEGYDSNLDLKIVSHVLPMHYWGISNFLCHFLSLSVSLAGFEPLTLGI
jgi:hypothetical protein